MYKNRMLMVSLLLALAVAATACCGSLTRTTGPAQISPAATPYPTYTPYPTPVRPGATVPSTSIPIASLESQVEAVYQQVGPSVVNITSKVINYNFFMQPVPQEGAGSGFIYDSDGHVVTNYHVVENAEEVTVGFSGGKVLPATIVGTDPSTDLAVLQVDPAGLPPPLPLADSKQLRVGQFVVAIGNPFRLDSTLTLGIISALERVIESPDGRFIGEAIQTDAAINPGNSGGPLLNLVGEVIGVNSQIVGVTGANVGIGFAISANTVRRVAPELISRGRYPHPWLGISALPLSKEIADAFREAGVSVAADEGLLILEATQDSPAARAGIRGGDRTVRIGSTRVPVGGDIITALDGKRMANLQQLTVYLESTKRVGDTAQVSLIRDNRETTVTVTLGERPTE